MPEKMHQKCTEPHPYILLRAFFKSHIYHSSYPIFPLFPTVRNAMCIFSAISVKKCTNKGNHLCSSLLKMSFHKHSPFLIPDSKIWSHRLEILVSCVCSNHFFCPTLFRTMHDKSPSSSVCSNNVAYFSCNIASVSSTILFLLTSLVIPNLHAIFFNDLFIFWFDFIGKSSPLSVSLSLYFI